MSSIGPQLPPHLSKRKRSPEDESPDSPPAKTTRPSNEDETSLHNNDDDDRDNNNDDNKNSSSSSDSEDGYGPAAPRAVGPTMPSAPTRPAMGPTMPADTNTDVVNYSYDSDSDSDDYGPSLPTATAASRGPIGPSLPPSTATAAPERLKRDDWMLAPPSASTGYQERDPTKIKSRKFASGATATTRPKDAAAGGISSIWTETPEEKAKRLADAVLGRGPAATADQASTSRGGANGVSGMGARREENNIRAFTEQARGKSLYEEHQAAKKAGKARATAAGGAMKEADEDDDDPSKRAFDREKDMGLGGKITASQRKELLNRASDFGGRFSKGSYL